MYRENYSCEINSYSYEINPRADALDGGWDLQLFCNDVEMGGGVYSDEEYDKAMADVEEWIANNEIKRIGSDNSSESLQAVTAPLSESRPSRPSPCNSPTPWLLGAEHPLVVVYNCAARVIFTATVQDLVLSALRHDPAVREAQYQALGTLAVSVAGVFVAPIKT